MKSKFDYKKKGISYLSVREFAKLLSDLPEEQQDWLVTCCGTDYFWLHFLGEGMGECLTIDHEKYVGIEDDYGEWEDWENESEYTEEAEYTEDDEYEEEE